MKAVLHIGAPKTGTSYLQRSLRQGKRDLAENHGILYPFTGRKFGRREFDRNVGLRFACEPFEKDANGLMEPAGVAGRAERKNYSAKFWDDLKLEIDQAANIHTVIMSDEALFNFSNKRMIENVSKNLDDHFSSVTLVAFVRRPSDYLVSTYSQAIKMGANKRWEDYLSEKLSRSERAGIFEKQLMTWKKHCRHDQFVVQPLRGDILEQFSNATCLDLELTPANSGKNSALSATGIQILRRINELCGNNKNRPPEVRTAFERFSTGRKWSPPSQDLKKVDEVFEAEILRISELFQFSMGDKKIISDWSLPHKPVEEQAILSEESIDELAYLFLELAQNRS